LYCDRLNIGLVPYTIGKSTPLHRSQSAIENRDKVQ
jgi:hypothetical protein